jgi:phosphatidylglycerol:prolipoprotein diacylglycerol transferase
MVAFCARIKVDFTATCPHPTVAGRQEQTMLAAIPFPNIGPDIFAITIGGFNFALRWYALAYIVGLIIGWRMVVAAMKRPMLWPANQAPMRPEQAEGLLTAVVLGVILGGRLGFVVFYQPGYYLQNPAEILQVWQGGMSFHGGMLGVAVAGLIFCRINKLAPMQVADAMALVVAPGLFLGRVANFINAELWGRPADVPWAVIFPGQAAQDCPGPEGLVERAWQTLCARHPSQLYEAVLEGLILGAILLWLAYRRGWLKAPGQLTGMFLAGYGASRFIVEHFRQPDAQFLASHPRGYAVYLSDSIGLTMGQLLSLPMIMLGIALIIWARRRAG